MKLYTIKDTKADYYHLPTTYRNAGEAVRAIENALKQKETLFAQNSEDFSLFEIGTFDESTGTLHTVNKKHICDLTELVPKQEITQPKLA